MQHSYRVNAYYWGNDRRIELSVEEDTDFEFDDLDWAPDEKIWSWYLDDDRDVDRLYMQLTSIQHLIVDVLRYDLAVPLRLH